MNIIQIVRRYGPVGGMERYVWETSRELAAQGHRVEIICERCYAEKPDGIAVHELGEIMQRPRWLALLRFSLRVSAWLRSHPRPGFVIHSHERVNCHHITTFHCQPFASVKDKPLWKLLSLRVAMQLYLEWRELAVAHTIVPVSMQTRAWLLHYYPQFAHKLVNPVLPGISSIPGQWHAAPANGGIIAFVGIEWRRKGLEKAAQIAKELRKSRAGLELWVIGPPAEQIRHLFNGWQGGYRLLGWLDTMNYMNRINLLLHPASAEAYGMTIAEAMSARIPVVVSENCGAARQVCPETGAALAHDADIGTCVDAVNKQLQRTEAPKGLIRSWNSVAREMTRIYASGQRHVEHHIAAAPALHNPAMLLHRK